jgi:tRNA-dihydrouridine synthase A
LGLYQGQPGARQFRRIISEEAHKPGASIDVLKRALAALNAMEHEVHLPDTTPIF